MGLRRWWHKPVLDALDHLHDDLIVINNLSITNLEADMATNDELASIDANLTEAFGELSGLPAQIDALTAAVEAGEKVDPALLADVKDKSARLANIVANTPPVDTTPPAETPPAEETPIVVDDPEDADPVQTEPADDAPADDAPADDAPAEAAPVDEAATPE